MSMFDRRYEAMPRAELEQLQLERLQALLTRVKRSVRRYREQLADQRIASLDDLATLPETTPEVLAAAFPYGMFALPLREVIRLHSTIGPEGTPIVIGHTQNDLIQWGNLVARQLVASGITANDVVQICLGAGVYSGFSGYVLGAEVVESSVIAEEPFHIDVQLAMLQNYRPTMLITTPANALELMQTIEQRRIDPQSLFLRTVLLSRPVDDTVRDELKSGLLVDVRSSFGIAEILDPGLCVECEEGRFHVNEDQFLVEVLDDELLVTTLSREAIPLLRYHTRIACSIHHEKCACGRTGVALSPKKRMDGRLRIKETPLYAGQIHAVVSRVLPDHPFAIDVETNRVLVTIEVTEGLLSHKTWPMENLRREIQSETVARLGIEAEVQFVAHLAENT